MKEHMRIALNTLRKCGEARNNAKAAAAAAKAAWDELWELHNFFTAHSIEYSDQWWNAWFNENHYDEKSAVVEQTKAEAKVLAAVAWNQDMAWFDMAKGLTTDELLWLINHLKDNQ